MPDHSPQNDRILRRGQLFVVGGAEDKERGRLILRRFVAAAGGSDARVVVVATASREPEELLRQYRVAFRSLGVGDLYECWQDRRADGDGPALVDAVRRASGVYFTGGDQLRLVATLGGTDFAAMLHRRHAEGLHIGGTSAGASALSTVMIARGRGRAAPRLSSVRLSPGLGILRRVIVDQHFRERDRIGRLMAAVLRNPYMLGFGIDEDTAFIVSPGGRVEVIGRGTLTIVDGHGLIASTIADARDHDRLAFAGMSVHVLGPEWTFDIDTRRARIPNGRPADAVLSGPGGAEPR